MDKMPPIEKIYQREFLAIKAVFHAMVRGVVVQKVTPEKAAEAVEYQFQEHIEPLLLDVRKSVQEFKTRAAELEKMMKETEMLNRDLAKRLIELGESQEGEEWKRP